MPFTTQQWSPSNAAPMGGMHDTDLRMFQSQEYEEVVGAPSTMLPPQLQYTSDADWASDYDSRSPTIGNMAMSNTELYSTVPSNYMLHNLRVPVPRSSGAVSAHSPTSSYGSTSPQQVFSRPQESLRPGIGRSHTAPANQLRLSELIPTSAPTSEKQTASEEDDDELTAEGDSKSKVRKRQRIPHTAVERRYREALNAGIKSLQAAVVASKQTTGSPAPLADDKPSKSSILHGAIEQIQTLSSDNVSLRNEVRALQAQLAEISQWAQAGVHGSY